MSHTRQAARVARAGHELLEASSDVITRRLEILAEGLRDPLNADLREITLMGSEKVEALSASVQAGLKGGLAMAATARAIAMRESEAARGAFEAVTTARTPMEAALTQTAWASAVFNRAVSDSWALGSTLLTLQTSTMKPIHAAATANARRLKRKP